MQQYKPGYLGMVMPVNSPSKMTDFVQNKFDAFSTIYDACKGQSENIESVKMVETPNASVDSLTVKIDAGATTISSIQKAADGINSVIFNGDLITARGNNA